VKDREGGALAVIERPPIVDTLRRTSRQLKTIRKAVAADGYIEELQEIDALVSVAQQEAERKLSIVENSVPPSRDSLPTEGIEPAGKAER
jgi:hypothetical protein